MAQADSCWVCCWRFIQAFYAFLTVSEPCIKIPTKRLPTKRLKPLTYLKYVILLGDELASLPAPLRTISRQTCSSCTPSASAMCWREPSSFVPANSGPGGAGQAAYMEIQEPAVGRLRLSVMFNFETVLQVVSPMATSKVLRAVQQ